MIIRDLLKPHQSNFIKLLLDQASLTLKGMELSQRLLDKQHASVAQEIVTTNLPVFQSSNNMEGQIV